MPDLAPYGFLDGVNRSVVIVTPREPYLEWARKVYADEKAPASLPRLGVALLIPEAVDEAEAREFLRTACGDVFREMLTSWCRDRDTWTRSTDNRALFTAWFELRFAGAAFDLGDDELVYDSEQEDLRTRTAKGRAMADSHAGAMQQAVARRVAGSRAATGRRSK